WARKFDLYSSTKHPKLPSEVLKIGDVVLVRATAFKKEGKKITQAAIGILEQRPRAEAALVAIEPSTHEGRALVGGYGRGGGTFNRAVRAHRRGGSTFKPIVYAAAFGLHDENGKYEYTPISQCRDAPRVYRDEWTGKSWKPENYGGGFD